MSVAIFPGSFNPFHDGHLYIINQALKVFDHIDIVKSSNPEKEIKSEYNYIPIQDILLPGADLKINKGLLADYIRTVKYPINAIIRGLRTSNDFESEKIQQYWNEDLGIKIPIFYIITDRNLAHISSSAHRIVREFKNANID